jgi:hypothetical protein
MFPNSKSKVEKCRNIFWQKEYEIDDNKRDIYRTKNHKASSIYIIMIKKGKPTDIQYPEILHLLKK